MTGESIQGRTVAFLLTDGFEQVELTEPWKAVQEAGGKPVLVSPKSDTVQGLNHIDKADTFDVDVQGRTPTRPTTTASCCPAAS